MTQDKIIELARQAGGIEITNKISGNFTSWFGTGTPEFLERFAKLVAQHEREKFCAALRQLHDSYSLASDSNAIQERSNHA